MGETSVPVLFGIPREWASCGGGGHSEGNWTCGWCYGLEVGLWVDRWCLRGKKGSVSPQYEQGSQTAKDEPAKKTKGEPQKGQLGQGSAMAAKERVFREGKSSQQ